MHLPSHVRLLDASHDTDADLDAPLDKLAFEVVLRDRLRSGDLVLCVRDDVIPADGVVMEGCGTILPPCAGDRAAAGEGGKSVRKGGRVASGYVILRVAADGVARGG